METVSLNSYLAVGFIVFLLGLFGLFRGRKSVIMMLLSLELILLAVNINLVTFSSFLGDLRGQIFTIFILTVAAAEVAIGLALLVVFHRNHNSIDVQKMTEMRG